MKSALNGDESERERNLKHAKVHLNRAGYDVFEILSSNLGLKITKSIEKYSSEIISRVFPAYYTEYQPKLFNIQGRLIEIRNAKNVDENWDPGSFEAFEKIKDEILEIYQLIYRYIPLLEKERKRSLLKLICNNAIVIITTLIIGIVVGWVIYKMGWGG